MKVNAVKSAIIAIFLTATVSPAHARWTDKGMAYEGRLEARVVQMTKQLELTPEQEAQIRAILEAERAKQRAERTAVRKKIDSVLTDEQRATRDAQVKRRVERHVARIADRLELNSETRTKLTAVMMEKLDDPNWTRDKLRERLSTVLTDDQLAELDETRPDRGSRNRSGCKKRRGNNDGF
ncbi:MAG: pilus assembly protein [Chromatiaceae bacterium]|jgi:Spy/CpxP family protein refolding chaperone|nr:pilus assembly protein [Chromatiaceae bacterium]